MSKHRPRFALVDVFTNAPFSGNPLAVVPDAQDLEETLLPKIAREFNQSETTFLVPATERGADWRLRSFTPAGTEVFGAGHNALGAWWWLAASGALSLDVQLNRFHQQLGERVLPLTIEALEGKPTAIVMQQAAPQFGSIVENRQALALALGVAPSALRHGRLEAQVVSTGTAHLMVPIALEVLAHVRPDQERLRDILLAAGGQGCYVFALTHGRSTAATTRFFNPVAGITEDPATGSAAGPLACYLRRYGLLHEEHVRFAQGAETGRPSELEIGLCGDVVSLRGAAVVAAEGVLHHFYRFDDDIPD